MDSIIQRISDKVWKLRAQGNIYFLDLKKKIIIDTSSRAQRYLVKQFLSKVIDFNLIEIINIAIMSFAYIGLFFAGLISRNPSYNQIVGIVGWIIWIFGLILAFSPNIVFKRRGGVPEGKSYIHTTKLVNDGIYGVIRHPQYTGGMVIAFSMCLIVQTPLAVAGMVL